LEDLSYVLICIVVLAALVGAAWTLWDRAQHDPWLRLLARVRKRLEKAGIQSTPATSPRQLALEVRGHYGQQGQALHDWLMRLEQLRYAAVPASGDKTAQQLHALRQEFDQLAWPA
jgi:hypothetical protein